jgi:hypothetical protein
MILSRRKKEVKIFYVMRKAILSLLVLFVVAGVFAQTNDVFTETGINIISKDPVKGSSLSFGGIYNKSRAYLVFNQFWVDGKIGLLMSSNNEWDSAYIGMMSDDTYINMGFTPAWHSEIVLGTDYDKVIPGTYLFAYDDILPDARFGNQGATYIFKGFKPFTGLNLAANLPIQYNMFTSESGMETNTAIYYESNFGLNLGTRMSFDFVNDFSMGIYLSGGVSEPFSWMLGYSYKGTGYDGLTPADHYFDGSMGADFGMLYLGADFEIGFDGPHKSRPMYMGILAKIKPVSAVTVQLTTLYSIENTKDYSNSTNTLTFKPKVKFEKEYFEFGIGADIMVLDTPAAETGVGLSFPVYMKYWL